MGILSAVFAEARAVARDIARTLSAIAEGRVEELHKAGLPVEQALQRGIQGLLHPLGRGLCAHGGPALGQGVYPAAPALRGAQGRAGVEPAAQIPGPVPGPVRRADYPRGRGQQSRCAVPVALAVQHGCKAPRRMREEPGQPHALAPALYPDRVHAVVPVPRQHERKAVLAHAAADDQPQRQRRVLQHRRLRPVVPRGLVAARLGGGQGLRVQPGPALVQERVVSRRVQVFADGPGQPDEVVRAAGPHAPVGLALVPPVHDVAFPVLVRAGGEDALPRQLRGHEQKIRRVLQLVPETVGPAALVYRGACHEPAGQGLVERPAVHIGVQLRQGRFYPQPAHGPGPEATRLLQQGQGALRFRKTRELLRLQKAADYDPRPAARQTRRKQRPARLLGGQLRRAGKARPEAQLRRPAAPVLGQQRVFLRPRADEGRVPLLIGQTGAERPLELPGRALYYHYPRPRALRDEERDAAAALFPLSPAEAEAHYGPGEKALPAAAERLAARGGKVPVQAAVHAQLAGVLIPHPRGTAVRRKTAEVSVGQREGPGPDGQAAPRVELEGPALEPAVRHGAAAPRLRQGRARGLRRLGLRELGPGEVHDQRRAGQDVLRSGALRRIDAAGRACQGLQPLLLQQLGHGAGEAAQVVPALAGEKDKVALHAADAQQLVPAYEVARRAQAANVVQLGADHGFVPGDADAPERVPGRAAGGVARKDQGRGHIQGGGQVPRAHAAKRGAGGEQVCKVLGRCGKAAGRCGKGRIRRGAEGQGEARGKAPGHGRKGRGDGAHPGVRQPAERLAQRVRAKLERAVRPQTEPALGQLAPGQTPYEQSALAHGGVQAQPPEGGVALPVPRAGEHGLELQAEFALQRPGRS